VSTAAGTRLRDILLRETVAWCVANSPYYRKRFPSPESFRGLADIALLPVLFREDVIENHVDLRCDASLPMAIQHTTGTTGASLQLYRNAAEQAFIWNFFSAQLQTQQPPNPRPLQLNLTNAYHGSLTAMPSVAYVLSAGVYDRAQAAQARGLLERSYDLPGVEPRVTTVVGTERMVKALTAYLMEDGFDLANSSVNNLVLFGGHVSVAQKLLLGGLWNAGIRDVYSLTEIVGGATECGLGGPWVFDPHVIPEVVHPRTLEPVTEGVGVLLLTGLYPFMQQMPLVRYCTNDLVEIVDAGAGDAELQVRYVGRLPRSFLDDTTSSVHPLLLSAPLYEILQSFPDVAVTPRFPDLCVGPGLELTGDHHYAVERRRVRRVDTITLRLGLRYAPWLYPDRVAMLVADITARVLHAHPRLAERVAEGRAEFVVEATTADEVGVYDSK
jgi:phenylacetate-coenzyme A ligase PaaK-like adenylate-forming protein